MFLNKCPVFFKKVFSKIKCRDREGCNTEKHLSAPLKKWKTSVHGDIAFGALHTDLSEAFGCLNHEFFITKLNTYRFT